MRTKTRRNRLSLALLGALVALSLVRCNGEQQSNEVSAVGSSKSNLTLESGAFLKDIQNEPESSDATAQSNPGNFTNVGGTIFFTATESTSGTELWKTDGTGAGTVLVADINPGSANSAPADLVAFNGKLYFSATDGLNGRELWVSDGTGIGTHPVLDINPGSGSANPTGLTVYAGAIYFAATHPENGTELWRTDGTAMGTQLVTEIQRGTAGGSPANFVVMNGALFFTANDGVNGVELWRTDGTPAGTWMVKDIRPGADGSNPQSLTPVGNTLFFSANDGTHGFELWATDGTQGNATLLGDINPGNSSSTSATTGPTNLFAYTSKNLLLFGHTNGTQASGGNGRELWVSDGSVAGTKLVKDIHTNGDSGPGVWAEYEGLVYFRAQSLEDGTEVFKTDGTTEGTELAFEVNPGNTYSDPQWLTVFNGQLFFANNQGTGTLGGTELRRYSAGHTESEMVKDINVSGDSDPQNLFVVGDTLYFTATDGKPSNGGHLRELWKTDGTESGTVLVKDINPPITEPSNPVNLFPLGDKLLFAATEETTANLASYKEPWVSDGTEAGTFILADIDTRISTTIKYGSEPTPFVLFKGRAYFAADDGSGNGATAFGREIYSTDGTPAGTSLLIDLRPGGDDGIGAASSTTQQPNFTVMGDHLYFVGNNGSSGGFEVFRTDGTAAGTELVLDLLGNTSSNPGSFTVMDDVLYFVANGDGVGRELHRTDGTPGGSWLVKDINAVLASPTATATGTSDIANLNVLGSKLVFTATDGVNGYELWASDGTEPGTVMLKDINPTSTGTTKGSAFASFTIVGSKLFFVADDGQGVALWSTDGTETGTVMVKRVMSGTQAVLPTQLTAVGSKLFFTADDEANGQELWVSDGTEAGTHIVKDIRVGATGASIAQLTAVGSKVFFIANDGPHGTELWVSDGTAAGTQLVKDILPGARGSAPSALTEIAGQLVFAADDGIAGLEPWVSDGTAAGTRRVADLNPGPLPSSPTQFVRAGRKVFVLATHSLMGNELAVLDFNDAPPVITCPADIEVPTASSAGATVFFEATAHDDGDAAPTITYTKDPGTLFTVGNTVVVATATDDGGNTSTCTFNVTVNFTDAVPPTITCPADAAATVTSKEGGPVTYEPATATDDNTANPAITYSHASGSVFPIGETVVTATAKDESNNAAVCTFLVKVSYVENQAPAIICPADVNTTSMFADGADVEYGEARVFDDEEAAPEITFDVLSGSRFPIGETVVTATARDSAGNTGTCTFKVTVTKTEAPEPEGCGCGSAGGEPGSVALALLLGLGLMARRTRRTA